MRPSAVDLFCGAGGLGLGFEQAGFDVLFASDIDGHAMTTYAANRTMPENRLFTGDIAELNARFQDFAPQFRNADIVCGGPPCQGFSTANRQRLLKDPRNELYRQYLAFLAKLRPPFFMLENVRGMAVKMPEIVADITSVLGSEYKTDSTLLNACDFGVPQNRKRLILVGTRTKADPAQILDSIRRQGESMPGFLLGDVIDDLPPLQPNRVKNNSKREDDDVGYAERPWQYKPTPYRAFINCGRDAVSVLYNHKNRYNNDRDIEIYTRLPQGANSLDASIADIMPYARRNGIFKDKYYRLRADSLCKTITSHMKFDCNMYIHPTQPRGLSPREAARVQTFPDDYRFTGPQNNWYQQIGNAVPPKLAEAIARSIRAFL